MKRRLLYFVIILLCANIILVRSTDCNAVRTLYTHSAECVYDGATEGERLIARFHTRYNVDNLPRCTNVALAAASINGMRLSGGEQLSFNEATGERTAERGYQNANIIYDGRYVEGLGGGVCQVSTTLYNAALEGGLDIIEVHAHSLRPDYVVPSRDAMVSYGECDLVIGNPYSDAVIFYASAKSGDLTVDIYGQTAAVCQITQCVTEELPPPTAKIIYDEEGLYQDKVIFKQESFMLIREKVGVKSCLKRERLIGGCKVSDRLREDIYKPIQGVIIFGTL